MRAARDKRNIAPGLRKPRSVISSDPARPYYGYLHITPSFYADFHLLSSGMAGFPYPAAFLIISGEGRI